MKKEKIVSLLETEFDFLLGTDIAEKDNEKKLLFSKLGKCLSGNPNPKNIMKWINISFGGFLSTKNCFSDDKSKKEYILKLKKRAFMFIYSERILKTKKLMKKTFGNNQRIPVHLFECDQSFYVTCKKYLIEDGEKRLRLSVLSRVFSENFISNISLKRNIADVVCKVVVTLEDKNPKKFSRNWLKKNLRSEYNFFENYLKKNSNQDWEIIKKIFPKKWQERFVLRSTTNRTLLSALRELRFLLEKNNPDYFYPKYIFEKSTNLYSYFARNYREEDTKKINWDFIISLLPIKWQYRWVIIPKTATLSLEEAINKLQTILKNNIVKSFSPGYIKKKNYPLYMFFITRMKDKNGYVDWGLILSFLDMKYQKIFSYPNNSYYNIPKTFYENQSELDRLIKRKKLKTYAFFAPANKENRKLADNAYREIIKLAKAGNTSAFDMLYDTLVVVTESWVLNIKEFSVLAYFREDINELIRKCIYMYSLGETKFLSYLYKTILYKAEEWKRVKYLEISLEDRGYYGDGLSNHEKISEENLVWDTFE